MENVSQGLDKSVKVIKLAVAQSEKEELTKELLAFLRWIEPMQAVDTAGTAQVLGGFDAVNVMREDCAHQGELAELQEAAPEFAGGFYMVPPIIE